MGGEDWYDITNSWLKWMAAAGGFVGYLSYLAGKEVTSAGLIRFALTGAVGGAIGSALGMQLVLDPLVTRNKVFAAMFIGSAVGAAALCYALRLIQRKESTDR